MGDWGPGAGDWEDLPPGVVAEPNRVDPIRSYEDLRVWQLGVDLAHAVYRATDAFPSDEQFGLTSQLRRAGVSIPSNLAEGWGRGSRADYRRFVLMARGSLYELETQLVLAERFGYLDASVSVSLRSDTQALSRQIQALVRALS